MKTGDDRISIGQVNSEKDLGVSSEHINTKIKIANVNLEITTRIFKYLEKEIMNLFKSLVRPHSEYASSVWSSI